jgi:chromosome partitioning protein
LAILIGVVSQKGGVGKSMVSRLIATEYARIGLRSFIADMDISQTTCYEWNAIRISNNIQPFLRVERIFMVNEALREQNDYDVIVFDGAPHATIATKQIAELCDLVILPVGGSIEDLNPQIRLAHELVLNNIDKSKLAFVLSKIGNSPSELQEVLAYLYQTEYKVVRGWIPEKTAFRQIIREGRTLTETKYKQLNDKALEVFDSVKSLITKIHK